MATQAVRNIMNNSIAKLMPELKRRVKEEGKKKLDEIKENLLSPEAIISALQPEINKDTCSAIGKSKFESRVDNIEKDIEEIEEQVIQGVSSLQHLEDQISPITTKAELPPGTPNPVDTITGISQLLQPVVETLNIAIQAAPGILAASSGPAASGTVIAGTNNNVNKAKGLTKEFNFLFKTVPRQLKHYQRMADNIYDNITNLKNKLQAILGQTEQLKSFVLYLEMDFLNKCGQLEDPSPPEDLTTGDTIPPQMSMEDLLAQIEELYGDLLNNLIAQGDQKAIERTFEINEKFERIKNTRVRTINI